MGEGERGEGGKGGAVLTGWFSSAGCCWRRRGRRRRRGGERKEREREREKGSRERGVQGGWYDGVVLTRNRAGQIDRWCAAYFVA